MFSNIRDFSLSKENTFYSTNKLKIFFVNAQSICSLEKFQAFQQILSVSKIHFDVIIVNETWFLNESLERFNLYNLNGYHFYHASRSKIRGTQTVVGGGIAIYVSNELTHKYCESVVKNYEKLSLNIRVSNEWIKIISYYRPPVQSNLENFFSDIEGELSDSQIDAKIIIGDMNLNLLENSNAVAEYKLLIESHNAKFVNKLVTRSRSNAILDHVITQSINDDTITHTVELPSFTDHNAVLSAFNIEKKKVEGKIITKKFTDFKKLNESFQIKDDEFYNTDEPNEKLKHIVDAFNNAMSVACKEKKFKLKKPSIIDSWLSVKVLELMKSKDHICLKLRKRRKQKLPCDKLKLEMKQLDKKIKAARINSYKNHFENVIKNGDTKSMWKEINQCIGKTQLVQKTVIEKSNQTITDETEVCNSLNNFFVNVGENIVPSANFLNKNLNKFKTLSRVENSFYLNPTSCEEVFNEIRILNKNKSAGTDGISTAIIQSLNSKLTPYLTNLINNMFDRGIYPDDLKEGIITAIPKCPKAKTENDFRPITVLNCMSKPIEKILKNRLEKYFNKIGVLDKNQFGFVKKSSTESAIMELHHRAMSALDRGNKLGIVVLDLRKAFDTMPHSTILQKMEMYGIRGTPKKLLQSYFTNRTQAVKLGQSKSDFKEINRGIAQGGIISPSLFNIGLNDFKNLLLKADTHLRFADDTVLLYEYKDDKDFIERVQHDLKITVEYFEINGMALNINKSNFLIFHKKKMDHLLNKIIIDDNNSLSRVSKCKYLGIVFDEHLTFKDHIAGIKSKLISTVNLLMKLKWYLPTFILRSLYFAHFHSHLCYIPFVWSFAIESLIKPLQILQNRALKHVYRLPVLYRTEALFNGPAKGILPVKGIAAQMTLNFVHNTIKNKIRSNIKFLINDNITKQNGQISRSNKKPPKTSFGKRDIMNIAPIMYNKLSKELRNSRPFVFKIKMKKMLETFPEQLLNLAQFSLLNLK